MIFVDATSIRHWHDCRELYRINQVENQVSAKTAIHREWGIIIHDSLEHAWRGMSFEDNLARTMEKLNNVVLSGVTPIERGKWDAMVGYTPDVLACYYDSVEADITKVLHIDGTPLLEYEWHVTEPFGIAGVTVCGRIDRVECGPVLVDTKTASEVGRTWRHDFKCEKLRDVGLGLYDWWLCSIGHAPISVAIEAVIKPYRDKPCRVERVQLHEIIAYRKRFAQQLEWTLREIAHYRNNYATVKPWPMNTNAACHGRFGACDYISCCTHGKINHLTARKEHLDVRKRAAEDTGAIQQENQGIR